MDWEKIRARADAAITAGDRVAVERLVAEVVAADKSANGELLRRLCDFICGRAAAAFETVKAKLETVEAKSESDWGRIRRRLDDAIAAGNVSAVNELADAAERLGADDLWWAITEYHINGIMRWRIANGERQEDVVADMERVTRQAVESVKREERIKRRPV